MFDFSVATEYPIQKRIMSDTLVSSNSRRAVKARTGLTFHILIDIHDGRCNVRVVAIDMRGEGCVAEVRAGAEASGVGQRHACMWQRYSVLISHHR